MHAITDSKLYNYGMPQIYITNIQNMLIYGLKSNNRIWKYMFTFNYSCILMKAIAEVEVSKVNSCFSIGHRKQCKLKLEMETKVGELKLTKRN